MQFWAWRDSHIRDRLVREIRSDTVRHKLLGKKGLTFDKCLEILRTSQVTSQRAQELSVDESVTMHAVRQEFHARGKKTTAMDDQAKGNSQTKTTPANQKTQRGNVPIVV